MKYRLLICLILTCCAHVMGAPHTIRDSVSVHFRQSKVNIDTAYMNNRQAFSHIRQSIARFNQPDSNFVLLNVKVIGGASPEGSARFNDWLSRQRATRIYDYMSDRMILPDSLVSHSLLGRDWEGLRAMVAADRNVPAQSEVLAALDGITNSYDLDWLESDRLLQHLKMMVGGRPYRYLYQNMFPMLRESKIVLTFGVPITFLTDMDVDIPLRCTPDGPLAIIPIALAPQKEDKPFFMALKTNLIADALALPEIGAEFYLGKNLSIVGNWMYGWWDNDRRHRYWRAYGGDVALRLWFGKAAHEKPLTGHHVGLYGGVVTYDFEFGGKGYMGGRPGHNLWDRCMHYFGVEYGYSLPVARRLNIDFTLGLGYMGGKYVEYEPKDRCYVWESTNYKHWFGPTKLEVSLVWLIGHGNYNKKGGNK